MSLIILAMANELHEMYDSVLTFANRAETSGGSSRIGGLLRQPRLHFSYLLGARKLLPVTNSYPANQLDAVAFPIAYLQRHALEMALKRLIEAANGIDQSQRWLSELRQDPKAATFPEKHPTPHTHIYDKLLKELRKALLRINYEPADIPTEINAMATQLTAIEQNEHTHFRYGAFERPVVLHLGKVQDDLEELFAKHLWIRDWEHAAEQDSLLARMNFDQESLCSQCDEIESRHGMTTKTQIDPHELGF